MLPGRPVVVFVQASSYFGLRAVHACFRTCIQGATSAPCTKEMAALAMASIDPPQSPCFFLSQETKTDVGDNSPRMCLTRMRYKIDAQSRVAHRGSKQPLIARCRYTARGQDPPYPTFHLLLYAWRRLLLLLL